MSIEFTNTKQNKKNKKNEITNILVEKPQNTMYQYHNQCISNFDIRPHMLYTGCCHRHN